MCNENLFADLENWDVEKDAPAKTADSEQTKAVKMVSAGNIESIKAVAGKYPCKRCNGRGTLTKYIVGGGYGQTGTPYNCPSCKGKGTLKTSPEARANNRAKAAERKTRRIEERNAERLAAANEWRKNNIAVSNWLEANNARGGFAESLNNGLNNYGSLTESQVNAVRKIIAANSERKAEIAAAPAINLSGLVGFMQNAKDSGLKFPKLHIETAEGQAVKLQIAGDRAKRPGTINITDGGPFGDNVFFGRIAKDGTLESTRACNDDVTALLVEMNTGDAEAIKVQGKRTGHCCCCKRELTNPVSIAAGIGPVCADKWGM